MCELDKIVANASKFNSIEFAENRHEIYTGPNFVLFDICYNMPKPYAHGQDGLLHFKVEFCVNIVSV